MLMRMRGGIPSPPPELKWIQLSLDSLLEKPPVLFPHHPNGKEHGG